MKIAGVLTAPSLLVVGEFLLPATGQVWVYVSSCTGGWGGVWGLGKSTDCVCRAGFIQLNRVKAVSGADGRVRSPTIWAGCGKNLQEKSEAVLNQNCELELRGHSKMQGASTGMLRQVAVVVAVPQWSGGL